MISMNRRAFSQGLAAAAGLAALKARASWGQTPDGAPDLILRNGRITTLDATAPEAQALAIQDGLVRATGSDADIMRLAESNTTVVDLAQRRVIPGLNDSHTHLIRGGLNYNMELRWEAIPSLADAL